jgi:hypothetical protein
MLKQVINTRFILSGTIILLLASCNSNPLKIDVSGVKLDPVKVDRMEKDMFSMSPDSIGKYTAILQQKYGRFYAFFVTGVINDGGIMDSTYAYSLKRFITDKDMHSAYDTCEKMYPDMSFLEKGVTDVFKHFKYYFPYKPLPKVVTAMSGFNYALVYQDSTLAISLDMYLGKKSGFYKMLRFPEYKIMHMNKDYMLSDAVYCWLESTFKPNEDKNDMLAQITHEGKIMYLMDALMPELDDTIKMRYTEKQLEWNKANEFNVWAHIIQEKLLFSTNQNDILKYTDDGPFNTAINHDCPARDGNWYGWQIVRSFMKHNRHETIPQLMAETNADAILKQSGYKPSK